MAYSDYGGYAYRNGKRVEDRSDATISPDGDVFGSPGPDRWKERSRTYSGVAEAMAAQWGLAPNA